MVNNPNAGGNTGATGGNADLWSGLANVKMSTGAAAKESVENKKFSLVSKFQAWRAEKEKNKALKQYDKSFDKRKAVEGKYDTKTLEIENKQLKEASDEANKKSTEKAAEHSVNEQAYKEAKDKDSFGEYALDQTKRAFELLKAGGSVLKAGIHAFLVANSKNARVKVSDPNFEDKVIENAIKKKEEFEEANAQKAKAKEKFNNVKSGFETRKSTYAENKAQIKEAKDKYNESKKELAELEDEAASAHEAFNKVNEEYKEAETKVAKVKEKFNAAEEKYRASEKKVEAAKEKVEIAESVIALREQLGKRDTNAIKAEIAQKTNETMEKVQQAAALAEVMGIPEDKREASVEALLTFANVNTDLSKYQEQLKVVEAYEEAKKKQAEKVAKAEPVKKGIRGLIAGFFSRKKAPEVATGSTEDEEAGE